MVSKMPFYTSVNVIKSPRSPDTTWMSPSSTVEIDIPRRIRTYRVAGPLSALQTCARASLKRGVSPPLLYIEQGTCVDQFQKARMRPNNRQGHSVTEPRRGIALGEILYVMNYQHPCHAESPLPPWMKYAHTGMVLSVQHHLRPGATRLRRMDSTSSVATVLGSLLSYLTIFIRDSSVRSLLKEECLLRLHLFTASASWSLVIS
jgi:hypothetical protein